MGVGGIRGGQVSGINVTPMIDVLLVLLVIFMVVQPQLQKGVGVQVPPAETDRIVPSPPTGDLPIVLEVGPGQAYMVNKQPVNGSLQQVLAGIFADRPRKVIFVKGAESLPYGEVVHAVDASRGAGVQVIGLVPRQEAAPAQQVTQ
jgi:biopolymer transport protein ExbD/biopolymer transport protein TolR